MSIKNEAMKRGNLVDEMIQRLLKELARSADKANVRSVGVAVSYTHLRAHETGRNLVCRLLLEKNFFNDTATTEIYTLHIVGSVRCV